MAQDPPEHRPDEQPPAAGDESRHAGKPARKPKPSRLTWTELRLFEQDLPPTLDTRGVARALYLSPRKVLALDASGELEAILIDGERVWLRSRVVEYVARANGLVAVLFVIASVGLLLCRLGVCPGHVVRSTLGWLSKSHSYYPAACKRKHHRLYVVVEHRDSPSRIAARRRARRGRRGRGRLRRFELVRALDERFALAYYRRFSLGGKGRAPPKRRGKRMIVACGQELAASVFFFLLAVVLVGGAIYWRRTGS